MLREQVIALLREAAEIVSLKIEGVSRPMGRQPKRPSICMGASRSFSLLPWSSQVPILLRKWSLHFVLAILIVCLHPQEDPINHTASFYQLPPRIALRLISHRLSLIFKI
jgi:hypothetical protein